MKMMMPVGSQICRCCLVEHPKISYNIFERENLCKDLMECVPTLRISPNDGLPDVICDLCWLRLRETVDFKRCCEESDKELREKFKELHSNENSNTDNSVKNFELCSALTVLDKTDFISEEAILCNSTLLPCELTAEEVAMLNELVLEDSSCPSNSTVERTEDPVIAELFNMVFNDGDTKLKTTNAMQITENSIDQSSIVSSTTSTKNPKKQTKKIKKTDHTCTECGKKFTRNFQLKLHLSSVHNIGEELQYQCHDCNKTFASLHSLNYHRKSLHTEERNFACTQCDRRFVLRSQLASHERIHTGQAKPRIHGCPECGKVWPTKSDLRTHMRVHNPNLVRRFKCEKCEKLFLTRGHLQAHELVHTGEKPFNCSLCDKSYQCVGNLNNHMVKHHSAFRSRYRHRQEWNEK